MQTPTVANKFHTPSHLKPSALHHTSQGFFAQPDMHQTGRSNNSLHRSDLPGLQNFNKQINQVRREWEGKPETDEYWQGKKQPVHAEGRDVMRSTGMEVHNTIDRQAEVFKNLKRDRQFDPKGVKPIEINSDYMMEDTTPMG